MRTSYGFTLTVGGTSRHWHWEWRTSLREITLGWAFWECGNGLEHGVFHLGVGLLWFDEVWKGGRP